MRIFSGLISWCNFPCIVKSRKVIHQFSKYLRITSKIFTQVFLYRELHSECFMPEMVFQLVNSWLLRDTPLWTSISIIVSIRQIDTKKPVWDSPWNFHFAFFHPHTHTQVLMCAVKMYNCHEISVGKSIKQLALWIQPTDRLFEQLFLLLSNLEKTDNVTIIKKLFPCMYYSCT